MNLTSRHVANGTRSEVVNTMHHEPRHGFQHQMTDDLEAGLLHGEKKREARVWSDNFADYKRLETHGYGAYYNQPVEVDVRKAGESAEQLFIQNGEKIDNIFL